MNETPTTPDTTPEPDPIRPHVIRAAMAVAGMAIWVHHWGRPVGLLLLLGTAVWALLDHRRRKTTGLAKRLAAFDAVVALVLFLLVALLSSIRHANPMAFESVDFSNGKMILLACAEHALDHGGHYPAAIPLDPHEHMLQYGRSGRIRMDWLYFPPPQPSGEPAADDWILIASPQDWRWADDAPGTAKKPGWRLIGRVDGSLMRMAEADYQAAIRRQYGLPAE